MSDVMDAANEQGSELIGHIALVLVDRGHDPAQVAEAVRRMDADSWWMVEGGPMLDRLEATLGLSATEACWECGEPATDVNGYCGDCQPADDAPPFPSPPVNNLP